MKASELMLGDWVSHRGENVRVSRQMNVDADLEPIPLTYEMLMKNFPDTEGGVTWYWRDTVFEIGIDINEYTINGIFHYVHELQHALRLCGIDKNIEL